MSDQCHICGPVKHEAPTVICAPCALDDVRRMFPGTVATLAKISGADLESVRLNMGRMAAKSAVHVLVGCLVDHRPRRRYR